MQSILEFFREKKGTFVKTNVSRENYTPAWVNTHSATWWPSQWDEVQVEEIDWEAFEEAVVEFEASFQKGGENSHRNPLNKGE